MTHNYSEKKQQELISSFLEQESLFRVLSESFDEYLTETEIRFTMAEIWTDAKSFVASLFESAYPDKMFSVKYNKLYDTYAMIGSGYRDCSSVIPKTPINIRDTYEQAASVDLILLCAMCMLEYEGIYSDNKNIIKTSNKLIEYQSDITESYAETWLAAIHEGCHNKDVERDYDYLANAAIGKTEDDVAPKQKACSLKFYMEDPVYNQCYEEIVYVLQNISACNHQEFKPEDYAAIYAEADDYVQEVLQSDYPEQTIGNIQARISSKYQNSKLANSGVPMTVITPDKFVGCMIEMIFVVALWDKMEEKNSHVMKAFKNSRLRFEYQDMRNLYTSNPMWKLIAERIPPCERKRMEDCEVEIAHLNEIIAEKNRLLDDKNAMLDEKDKEIEMAHAGWDKSEGEFKTKLATERVAVMKYLLDMPNSITGTERTDFKELCKLETKCPDSTLERLLSNNSLIQMENSIPELLEKYPILKKKTGEYDVTDNTTD